MPSSVDDKLINTRIEDYGLTRTEDWREILGDVRSILFFADNPVDGDSHEKLYSIIQGASEGSRLFVYGPLAESFEKAQELSRLASGKRIALLSGTYMPTTWRLPSVDLEWGRDIKKSLIVTVGNPTEAMLLGVEGLLSVIERRSGGEPGIQRIRVLRGNEVWSARDQGLWSEELLASALSRSHTPQGNSLKDARTQDLVRLKLVSSLARDPQAIIIDHMDGLRSAILLLNGVVKDILFAVKEKGGAITSSQFYRPVKPNEHHFSSLAHNVRLFFGSGNAPWPGQRNLLIAGIMESFQEASVQKKRKFNTPHLAGTCAYQGFKNSMFCKI